MPHITMPHPQAQPRRDAEQSSERGRLSFVFHGTRGSIPVPGRETLRYGGNTPCVEVRVDGRPRLILDAGSGIVKVGDALDRPVDIHLLLTHFHWDHIQGLPFFSPLYESGSRLRISGPAAHSDEVERTIRGQMAGDVFPVSTDEAAGHIEFDTSSTAPRCLGGLKVTAIPVNHPGCAVGYRIANGDVSFAYIPDNELGNMSKAARITLLERLQGVDALIHDAMYMEDEYSSKRGWGHSTGPQALKFAEEIGARRLFLFHHAPGRTDAQLDHARRQLVIDATVKYPTVDVQMASEAVEVSLVR